MAPTTRGSSLAKIRTCRAFRTQQKISVAVQLFDIEDPSATERPSTKSLEEFTSESQCSDGVQTSESSEFADCRRRTSFRVPKLNDVNDLRRGATDPNCPQELERPNFYRNSKEPEEPEEPGSTVHLNGQPNGAYTNHMILPSTAHMNGMTNVPNPNFKPDDPNVRPNARPSGAYMNYVWPSTAHTNRTTTIQEDPTKVSELYYLARPSKEYHPKREERTQAEGRSMVRFDEMEPQLTDPVHQKVVRVVPDVRATMRSSSGICPNPVSEKRTPEERTLELFDPVDSVYHIA